MRRLFNAVSVILRGWTFTNTNTQMLRTPVSAMGRLYWRQLASSALCFILPVYYTVQHDHKHYVCGHAALRSKQEG